MNNIKQLKEQHRESHPGFSSYLECSSRGLLTGLSAFVLSFSAVYFSQKILEKKLPYSKNGYILVSTAVACAVSYKVTKDRMNACQAAWMAFENKFTSLKSDQHQREQPNIEE